MNNRKPQRKNHTKSTSNASHSKRSHKPAGRSGSHKPEAQRRTNALDKAPAKTYIVQEPAELLSF